MNGCLEKQSFGKSSVCLSVPLPLRHPLPAFDSTGDDRHCAEGAEGSKKPKTQKTSGKLGMGWDTEELRALPPTAQSCPLDPVLTTHCIVGISSCPDENLVVAKGGRTERRELGLLLCNWDRGTNGMSLRKQALRAKEQLALCLLREKLEITLKKLCTNACYD